MIIKDEHVKKKQTQRDYSFALKLQIVYVIDKAYLSY